MNYNINVKNTIDNIKLRISEIESNCKFDSYQIELNIMNEYKEFYEEYPFLVKKLCKREDLGILDTMLAELDKIQNGQKTIEETENELGDKLAKQYLNIKKNN